MMLTAMIRAATWMRLLCRG